MAPTEPAARDGADRRAATDIVATLRRAGHTAYFAGGCVRDELLGLPPKDYDVATSATPAQVTAAFPHSNAVGAAFGVVLVRSQPRRGDAGERIVTEVATFRTDGPYSDARRPDRVRFASPEADAQRRDFTINALFLDPLSPPAAGEAGSPLGGRVIDYVQGRADLAARLVRAVGDPAARLAEDHLRALRAVRLTCRLGFALDAATAEAVRTHAQALRGVSRERIGDELRAMLAHPSRAAAAQRLRDLGLEAAVFGPARAPSASGGDAADDAHAWRPLTGLAAEASAIAALAALAVVRGEATPAAAAAYRAALCLSNEERERLSATLAVLARLRAAGAGWLGEGTARQKRDAAGPGFAEALHVLRAMDPEAAGAVAARVEALASHEGGLQPPPLVDGNDLIGMGLTPGPAFARILNGVYDAQLEGRVREKASAAALARELSASLGVG